MLLRHMDSYWSTGTGSQSDIKCISISNLAWLLLLWEQNPLRVVHDKNTCLKSNRATFSTNRHPGVRFWNVFCIPSLISSIKLNIIIHNTITEFSNKCEFNCCLHRYYTYIRIPKLHCTLCLFLCCFLVVIALYLSIYYWFFGQLV